MFDQSTSATQITVGPALTAGTTYQWSVDASDSNGQIAYYSAWGFAVTRAQTSQTITFGALGNVTLGAASFTITATASSGLTVTFASTTPSVCTVSGNTVSIVAAGTCSITASQGGNASYAAATPVTRSFAVGLSAVYSYYYVNQTIGGIGLTGDIVTDGTIGVLAQSNIIGYNLQLSDPAANPSTFSLSCCYFFPFDGSDLSATATQLLFNFSGTDSGVVDFAAPSLDYDVCFSTSGGASGPGSFCEGAGETLTFTSGPVPIVDNFQFTSQSGTGVIGNILSIISLPGGSGSSPVLLTAPVVGQVTGTIGGLGSEDYYTFYWPGGAFSATASIAGASGGASYLFSEGASIDGCNSATATLNSGDSFTSTIAITNLAPGSYCIGIDANNSNDPSFAITFNTPVDGAVIQPQITNVTNGASNITAGLPNAGIAQGAIFLIFGSNLGPGTISIAQNAFQNTSLSGTSISVTVNGTTVAPLLYYTSATQVAALLPSNTPVGTGTITVTYNGQPGIATPITVVQNNLGIFTVTSDGQGAGIVTNADYSLVSVTPGTPCGGPYTTCGAANPGDTLILWATGLGPISGSDASGAGLGVNMPNIPLKLWLGGVQANVIYQGRSGCCIGEDQIVFTVPANVPLGCAVPLAVQIGNQISNYSMMPVAQKGTRTCTTSNSTFTSSIFQQINTSTEAFSFGNVKLQRQPNINAQGQVTGNTDTGKAKFQSFTVPARVQPFIISYLDDLPPGRMVKELSGSGVIPQQTTEAFAAAKSPTTLGWPGVRRREEEEVVFTLVVSFEMIVVDELAQHPS